jgi:ABC-type uncharacterized transport system involved in gliding motility auxiliary subunit
VEIELLKRYSGIIGIFLILAASLFYSLYPGLTIVYLPLFAIGLIVTLFAVAAHFRLILNILRGKAVKYSINSIVYIMIIFSIIAVLNFISFRNHKRFDTTLARTYSLSPQSIKVLENLEEPVHISCFFTENNKFQKRMEDRLELYRYHSPLITFEFIDPLKQPGRIEEKGLDADELGPMIDGMSLIEGGGRKIKLFKRGEQDVTSAIIESLRKTRKIVYFLQGHGEKNFDDAGGQGYSKAAEALKSEYYDVESLILTSDVSIPEDCTVLIIPGPEEKILDFEVSALKRFILRGGRLLIMMDPGSRASLDSFLQEVGLEFHNTMVIDPRYNYLGDQRVPRIHTYSSHEIVFGWNKTFFTIFPIASSVSWVDAGDSRIHSDNLAKSSREYSWGETDAAQPNFDPKSDRPGPLGIVSISLKELEADEVQDIQLEEGEVAEFRIILIGDSDCFSNGYFDVQANGNFFLNIIGWLAQEENLVSIRRKTLAGQSFLLSSREQLTLLYSLLVLPILVIIIGVAVWIRRRTL